MGDAQQNILKQVKQFRMNSIFFSYLKYIFALLSVPFFIITIFIVYHTYSNIHSKFDAESYQISERSYYVINDAFNNISRIYNQFPINNNVSYLLSTDIFNSDTHMLHQTKSKFYDFIYTTVNGSNILDSIYLYSKLNDYVYAIDSSNTLDDFQNSQWYKNWVNADMHNTVCKTTTNGKEVLTIIMNIYENSPHAGVLIFNIDTGFTENIIHNMAQEYITYEITLVSDDNNIVYLLNSDGFDKSRPLSALHSHPIDGFPVDYQIRFNYDIGASVLDQMLSIIITYLVFIVILIIFTAFMCSRKFYQSIVEIMAKFESVTQNGTTPTKPVNELHYISENIVNTLAHSKQIESDLVLRLTELKKAQSIALQTQMNPHFLFNTLSLVNSLIIEETGADTEAVMVIDTLSELLHSSLDTKIYIVSVEDELSYAKKYVDIEMIKNDYNFIVEWDIRPEVLNMQTLKMVLQPIIENAIFYGIGSKADDDIGRIVISAYIKNDNLVFCIQDNGTGIEPQILADLVNRLSMNEFVETKHIGLSNVNNRINLLYGSGYGIRISSSSAGTRITITQPIKLYKKEN